MKTNDEFYNDILRKKDIRLNKRKKKVSAVSCAAIIIAVSAAAFAAAPEHPSKAGTDTVTQTEAFTETENSDALTEEIAAEAVTEIPAGNGIAEMITQKGETDGYIGFTYNYVLSRDSLNAEIKESEEVLTAEEVKNHILLNEQSIISALSFDPSVGQGNYRIYTKGYSHIRIESDDSITLVRNFVTVPVMKDEKIVAAVDVYKTDGKISDSIAYGGESFSRLNDIFNENPESELVFAYINEIPEVIITSENKVYSNPFDIDYEKNVDYYSAFKTPYNTFSRAELDKPENYIGICVRS